MSDLSPERARADLAALARHGSLEIPLRRGDAAARRSAVLILFGLLEASDLLDPAGADVDVLLTRRSPRLRHHPGQIAFPGGGIDPGESAAVAAVREAAEETGLDPSGVEVIGALADVPLVVSGNVVTPVLAWWAAPSALTVDGTETVEAFRVPIAHLLDPARRGVVRFSRHRSGTSAARTLTTPAFDLGGDAVVWGFTAFVLDALLDALGWTLPWDRTRELGEPRW